MMDVYNAMRKLWSAPQLWREATGMYEYVLFLFLVLIPPRR
jgi:hypothetical protein